MSPRWLASRPKGRAGVPAAQWGKMTVTYQSNCPAGFLITCEKLANGDHVTIIHCKHHKGEMVAKHPNHDHMTPEMLQQLEFRGPITSTSQFSTVVTSNSSWTNGHWMRIPCGRRTARRKSVLPVSVRGNSLYNWLGICWEELFLFFLG